MHSVVQGQPTVVILNYGSVAYDYVTMDPKNVAIANMIDNSN